MARIIYAVAGEGFGHSSRSHLIGQRLIEAGNDVIFAGSNKSLTYLREHFGDRVKEIFGLLFDYTDGKINPTTTVLKNIWRYGKNIRINNRLYNKCFDKFKPDLLITDFEPFSVWWALRHRVPFFSIDHQHMLTHCRLEHPKNHKIDKLKACVVTRAYYYRATSYVVINFFKAQVKKESVVVAPPVIRPQVEALKPTDGEHITIYTTYADNEEQLRKTLHLFSPQEFFVYGFNKYDEDGNVTFKERSTESFLNDVASSKGLIASAGFSSISECMYLRKKMCLLPIPGQYEQIINAHYVEKLGLGLSRNQLNEQALNDFLVEIEKPMPDDDRSPRRSLAKPGILWPSNERFFEVLETQLKKLRAPIKI
ncbi:MAG: hypothetical protein JW804_06740 [Sedimentisphaerales bacterium]|nr:hypothetical protein [Sedimentisphaerales bacterium]